MADTRPALMPRNELRLCKLHGMNRSVVRHISLAVSIASLSGCPSNVPTLDAAAIDDAGVRDGAGSAADSDMTDGWAAIDAFSAPDAFAPPDTMCAADIELSRASTNVVLVVDETGSMGSFSFPTGASTTGWTALHNVLMANPDGIVHQDEHALRWGQRSFEVRQARAPP